MDNAHLQVKFAAFAVGQRAKVNDLPAQDVDELAALTQQLIKDPDDDLRRGVLSFVTQYEIYSQDPAALAQLGVGLVDLIDRLNQPPPPDFDRADIYG